MSDTAVETPLTFEQEVDKLLAEIPDKTIGEYVRTTDVQDLLLDIRQLSKQFMVGVP